MYEAFSIISGIALLVFAALPGLGGRDRLWSAAVGAAFLVYGVYVSQQTSGLWIFPVWIFVIPFLVAAHILYLVVTRLRASDTAPTALSPSPAPAPGLTHAPGDMTPPSDVADGVSQPGRTVFDVGTIDSERLAPLTEGQRIARAVFDGESDRTPTGAPGSGELTEGQRIARDVFGIDRT